MEPAAAFGPKSSPVLEKAIERACHDVGKGSDDKEGEEPAEQEEHLAARLANVLFNDLAHALAVVAD